MRARSQAPWPPQSNDSLLTPCISSHVLHPIPASPLDSAISSTDSSFLPSNSKKPPPVHAGNDHPSLAGPTRLNRMVISCSAPTGAPITMPDARSHLPCPIASRWIHTMITSLAVSGYVLGSPGCCCSYLGG